MIMKRFSMAMAVSLIMALCAASAMGWGSATHAYIDEHLNKKGPLLKLNQVYGGMAGDVFNFMTDKEHPEYQPWLAATAHCEGFNKMWQTAFLPAAKSQAYGFISHNQDWGADFYAHNYSCPENYPPTQGYIEEKAKVLFYAMYDDLEGLGLNNELGKELLRDVIEYAVDILILRQDPAIGQKVTFAALLRSPEFPLILNAAYAQDFSRAFHVSHFKATKIIAASESQFRQTMAGYGQILALGKDGDEIAVINAVSEQLVQLGEQLFGITIPQIVIQNVIGSAIQICQDDYLGAVGNAIDEVRAKMGSHGFIY
jgi:hypothetical protein